MKRLRSTRRICAMLAALLIIALTLPAWAGGPVFEAAPEAEAGLLEYEEAPSPGAIAPQDAAEGEDAGRMPDGVSENRTPQDARGAGVVRSDALMIDATLSDEGARCLVAADGDYTVRLYPSEAESLPEGAEAFVREIAEAGRYRDLAARELDVDEMQIESFRAFDISIVADGVPVALSEPAGVEIDLPVKGGNVAALHFPGSGEGVRGGAKKAAAPEALETRYDGRTVRFETDGFSVFAIAGYTLEKRVLASDGSAYLIKVAFGPDAGIPEDADLSVTEIGQAEGAFDEPTDYEAYLERTERALGAQSGSVRYARFFDIDIVDGGGASVAIAEGAKVEVGITLDDLGAGARARVVHFGESAQVLDAEADGGALRFETDGFSVYAIVDAPEPAPASGWYKVTDVGELAQLGGDGLYVRTPAGYYFMDEMYQVNASRTGILKTNAASNPDAADGAVKYCFEAAGDGGDTFLAYCETDDGRRYVRQQGNSLSLVAEVSGATAFTVEPFPNAERTFRVRGQDGYYWNMQGGTGGRGFAAYNVASDTNARMQFEYYYENEGDPYGLGGRSYGIAWHDARVTAAAMLGQARTEGEQQRLAGADLVMKPDVLDNDGSMFVAPDSQITFWRFEHVRGDTYRITTEVDGRTKYLTINEGNVTLEDEPDDVASVIRALPGTGANAGKWHFSVGNYSLNLPGTAEKGFNAATGSGARTWMNLVKDTNLDDDAFTPHTARKVSVSDPTNIYVYNHAEIVLYTRVWNEAAERYDFYVVDHDGSLIPCYDTGDGIEWIGTDINTAVWDLEIYYDAEGGENQYYDFKNTQYNSYIVPSVSEGTAVAPQKVGVNLAGRKYGEDYTTIIAWDAGRYAYSGLRPENGRLVPCALADAEDFYFAVMEDKPEPQLSTVTTVEGAQHGISMKMIDFNNAKLNTAASPRDSVQNPFFGGDNNNPGLLTTDLQGGADGYPSTTDITNNAGHSLSELFSDMTDVDHLFIQSIYNESGYFEYDSTSIYARLNGGTFTVYDQIGAIYNYYAKTNEHGQFMPYDDISDESTDEKPALCTFTNRTDVLANELDDTDPRKGERLYNIGTRESVDYHFGMEMTASFTQTANGLDAWGHDIVFEFSGDDDFWFYVDGELVLDLGGVHSAMTGSINFRTGVVKSSRGNSTLYDIFKSHYTDRGMDADAIARKLDEIFTTNENGQHVFRDYTRHTMRMFYMERGAGASNLHMRFNLASVKPGSFTLNKKLSGTDSEENDLIEFPYQIWYKTARDGEALWYLLGAGEGATEEEEDIAHNVHYKDKSLAVRHEGTFTPAGGSEPYAHVFFLKPGQTAEIALPEDATLYKVIECGVNPDIYDEVLVNGDIVAGEPSEGNAGRNDYASPVDSIEDRQQLEYVNHVAEGAMRSLTITKVLYDVNGEDLLHYPDNETLFNFRLYLGTENADADSLRPADRYSYYVKGPDGFYCRRDPARQAFVSTGIDDYETLRAYLETLSSIDREAIEFYTSQYGSISDIPVDHMVEVRDLVAGTQYKVLERDDEIPKGYRLRQSDGYTRTDVSPEWTSGDDPFSDTIEANETPAIDVRNQKGWGLTVEKAWADRDFMDMHDPVYFAVFVKGGSGGYNLITRPNTVRKLLNNATADRPNDSIYYFFDDLEANVAFDDYEIFEVTLTGDFHVDAEGRVTGYDTVTRVPDGGRFTIGGRPSRRDYVPDGFTYTAGYTKGEPTEKNENIRTDTWVNSRPGIEIYKTDMDGRVLSGAVFTLTDADGEDVSLPSFTSGPDGLVTIAYLPNGVYTLTETVAPEGFTAPDAPLILTVSDGGLAVSGADPSMYAVTHENEDMIATLFVRDRPAGLLAMKVDAESNAPLEGAHFELYWQITDSQGNKRKDYRPMAGYEDIVTDENGILPGITLDLDPWTYYLTETQAPAGYRPIGEDICFTIGYDGAVTMNDHAEWLEMTAVSGNVSYTLAIPDAYAPEPAEVVVSGEKTLLGRDMRAGEFTFTMTPVDTQLQPAGYARTAVCAGGGAGEATRFSFAPLAFTYAAYRNAAYRDGEGSALFYYVVEETIPSGAPDGNSGDMRYDTTRYLVVITLSDRNGALTARQRICRLGEAGIPHEMLPVSAGAGAASPDETAP